MGNLLPTRAPLTRDDYRRHAEDALLAAERTARNATGIPMTSTNDNVGLAAVAQAKTAEGWIALLNTPGGR